MLNITMIPPCPSGVADGAWTPDGCGRPEVEQAVGRDDQLVAILVVVAQQVLAAARVAEEQEHVAVAYRPEVGTCAVISHQREPVVLGERMQIFPGLQVLRAEDEIGRNPLPARAFGNLVPAESE